MPEDNKPDYSYDPNSGAAPQPGGYATGQSDLPASGIPNPPVQADEDASDENADANPDENANRGEQVADADAAPADPAEQDSEEPAGDTTDNSDSSDSSSTEGGEAAEAPAEEPVADTTNKRRRK